MLSALLRRERMLVLAALFAVILLAWSYLLLATCCGFPARASLMERERSVEDVESPRRCGGSVTLSPEVHHFFILRTAVIMAPRRAITTRVPWWPMLAEVAQIDHRIGQ